MTKPDAHKLLFDQLCHFTCLLKISEHRPLGFHHELWRQNIVYLKVVSRALREGVFGNLSVRITPPLVYMGCLTKHADHGLFKMLLAYALTQDVMANVCSVLLA